MLNTFMTNVTKTYIRSSAHDLKETNIQKQLVIIELLTEYRRIGQEIIDHLWTNGYTWPDNKGELHLFDVHTNQLKVPSFIDYNLIPTSDTFLTARAKSSLVTQIAGMLSSACEKQRKRLHQFDKLKSQNTPKRKLNALIKKIKANIPQKPNTKHMGMELSSKCSNFREVDGKFVGFLQICSFSKVHERINLPIEAHQQSNRLAQKGTHMNSYLIHEKSVDVRWKITQSVKSKGMAVGVDQGLKDVITCSNGFISASTCPHGHSLESILDAMCRKKPGSKAMKRCQAHRKNFINYLINNFDLSDISEVRLEEIINICFKKRSSKKLSHWTNRLIRDKLQSYCEEHGVRFTLVPSTYRSRRCSNCGIVRKSNRKGKIYICIHCGHEMDADVNASINILQDLPEIPWNIRKKNMNRGNGFYWKPDGFYDYSTGRILESLLLQEVELIT